jgi:outer membrane protein OmpA-like peptidoglycan-associated protein
MKNADKRSQIRLESKRHTELWIYSFADMYMILAVFFIAIATLYAAKAKHASTMDITPSAGRGPAAVTSMVTVEFPNGSDSLNEKAENNLKLLLPTLVSSQGVIDVEGYADDEEVEKFADSEDSSVASSHAEDHDAMAGFSSNLDLSNSRAVRVAEWLMRNGVAPKRVRTYSYGDSHLFPTGQNGITTNRRVVLKMLPVEGG